MLALVLSTLKQQHHHQTTITKCNSKLLPLIQPIIKINYFNSSTTTTTKTDDNSNNKGYQSIGSFHSDNLEYLIAIPKNEYKPPPLPFDPTIDEDFLVNSSSSNSNKSKNDFMIDFKNWTFINHGAFGGALKCGFRRGRKWNNFLELQPLRYFDRELLPHLVYSTRQMAEFIHGDTNAISLIQNCTQGLNAVISGYARSSTTTKKIILFDTAYGSVKKMCRHYCGETNVVTIPFEERFPLSNNDSDKDWVEALMDTIDQLKKDNYALEDTLLLLDHTTSNTALNVPIQKLATIAKQYNMMVLVDGAHGLLVQDLNMKEYSKSGIDFYVSNAHKWMSSPRGAGFLYCEDEELRESILRVPAVISHGIDDGFISRFIWDGCRDYTAQLSLPTVIQYWNTYKTPKVRNYIQSLLTNAVDLLIQKWHPNHTISSAFEKDDHIMIAPMLSNHSPMAFIRLPTSISGCSEIKKTSLDAKMIQDYLYHNGIEVPIKCIQGKLFVRISCHVYNEIEDYDHLAYVILKFPNL